MIDGTNKGKPSDAGSNGQRSRPHVSEGRDTGHLSDRRCRGLSSDPDDRPADRRTKNDRNRLPDK